MELLYIWIESYGGISGLNLNFSNRIKFTFDAKEQLLTVKTIEYYTPDFFSTNITHLTGIIGANGSGKTSILRYIIEYCTDGIRNHEPKGAILVYARDQEFYYYSSMDLKLEGQPNREKFVKVLDLDGLKTTTTAVYLSNQFDPTSFYANDYTRTKYGKTANISTWYLLHSDLQTKYGQDANDRSVPFDRKMEAFASMEFMRMVRVLRWINNRAERNPFPVQMPPYLNLKLNFNNDSLNKAAFADLTVKLKNYFNIRRSEKDLFLLRAFEAAIYHFVDESIFLSGRSDNRRLYMTVLDGISVYLSSHSYANQPEKAIAGEIASILDTVMRQPELEVLRKRVENIRNFLDRLAKFINTRHSRVDNSGSILSISIRNANLRLLEDLIDEYYRVDKIGEYADFYFSHAHFNVSSLSSGEYTFLTCFGRLNGLKLEKKQSILLLIDEAEQALHPQWQKMFINVFVDFVSERFKDHQVQVILTSHSPFILSDLPPHCVILLKREAGTSVVVDSLDKKNETFGANVHELFTDSFFLQDGLIGEFARRKIEDLVKRINQQNVYTKRDYDAFKREIDIIGEPFVRFKLLERIMNGLPREEFDNVIVEREKELALIKKIRNDKN